MVPVVMGTWRARLRILLVVAMVGIGVAHFARPGLFVSMVPSYLPAPLTLVLVSGFFEVLGAVGLLVPRVRRAASYGLVLLYLAVFPANLNMALHPELFPDLPVAALWGRLPFQVLFIVWALWAGREDPARNLAGEGAGR
jgi:uncharacterized membrane protein